VAVLAQEAGQVGGDVGFPPAGERDVHDVEVGGVGRRTGRREPCEFVGVLDRAQHRQAVGQRDVRRRGQRPLQAEQVQGPGRVAHAVPPVRAQQPGRDAVRVAAVGPVGHRQRRRAGRLLGVGTLQRGHQQRRRPADGEDEQREPLGDRGRLVSGEPGEVGTGCDEHPGQPGVGRGPGGPIHPGRVVVGRERRRHRTVHGRPPKSQRIEAVARMLGK
jgi:hypothetical protein